MTGLYLGFVFILIDTYGEDFFDYDNTKIDEGTKLKWRERKSKITKKEKKCNLFLRQSHREIVDETPRFPCIPSTVSQKSGRQPN